ncbi:hypothetical protein Cylst_4254 [Cylindrospermum stagnale PCC 7417]|uniref:Uncharacterized protein n=1 Tax=Cylindrospermum stagnale PCC 7417 TaxID=56107 RepID=K9X3S5_9NOST|nr:hypothetical protein [Cylindrospermum stagnale]AFZ26352.1 hypothetical protein Cylst_4254 [Cylindrospermum stagnale PCC 7417]
MAWPIQLSLAGDGRLVILTPQTLRRAFFQFTKVNREYTSRDRFPLNRPFHEQFKLWKHKEKENGILYRSTYVPDSVPNIHWQETKVTLLDALYRTYLDREKLSYLNKKEIQFIEKEINKQIVWNNLALVNNEGSLLSGYGICQQTAKNREKVKYIRRYGMIFILEPIMRQAVLKAENVDLFIQDKNFDFHLVRYHGVLLSSSRDPDGSRKAPSYIELLFRHRLDFSITWTCTLDSFQPRQIFRIIRIYPCDGFRIVNYG